MPPRRDPNNNNNNNTDELLQQMIAAQTQLMTMMAQFMANQNAPLMHVKCIHELCIVLLIIPSYFHHIRFILMFYIDLWEEFIVALLFWN